MNKLNTSILLWVLSILLSGISRGDNSETTADVYGQLPVKEVTIFKDGHAYLLHEGQMKTDTKGNVLLDNLPAPVMGTFWAYSADSRAALNCVISSRNELDVECPSVCIEDLLKGNIGKDILIKDIDRNETYQATILRFLEDQPKALAAATSNIYVYSPPAPPSIDRIVLLKTAEGIKAVNISRIQALTFLDTPSDRVTRKQPKDTITLKMDWNGTQPASEAKVGMAYVQRGIRWIPNYRVEIDGHGKAVLKLQATLINELADLNDVKAHLVIGVPNFTFKDTPDPISFQETVAQLSSHFRPDSSTAYAFSNAIMTQQVRANYEYRSAPMPGESVVNLGPELESMAKTEDLFVFTLDHITLKRGQRMMLPIAEFTLLYEDVYTVDISFAPPMEMRRNFDSQQQLELAKLFHKPNAIHKIRLDNTSEYPLTTAPATILKDGRVLSQGMTTYTAIGNKGDLELTTAVNIGVKHSDEQTNLIPNAVNWNGNSYSKIEMLGSLELTNFSDKPVTLQIHRSVLGTMDAADSDGSVKQLGNGYDGFAFDNGLPFWWNWCSWPWWWYRFNNVGQAVWTLELGPKESRTLTYNWHYFWG
jgi:hypothetical protein